MKKVLIIAYYFPPLGWSGVQRTLKFVKYLRDFGWEPVVVTVGKTKFSILDESLLEEVPKEIEVTKIDDVKFKDITDEIKEKMREYTKYSFDIISDENLKNQYEKEIEDTFEKLRSLFLLPDGNAVWANNVIKEIVNRLDLSNIDIIYTTSGPYSTHLIGHYLKKKYNLPWVCDFRDEWTNNAFLNFNNEGVRYRVEKNIEKEIVINANRLITTTESARLNYINIFKLNEDKVLTITNGYDEEDFKLISTNKIQNKDKFVIAHNGTFYLSINPYSLIKAIDNLLNKGLLDRSKIQCIFLGANDKEIIKKSINMIGNKENIFKFIDYVNHKESLDISSKSHLLLLVLGSNEKSKNVFPGKIFEYLRLKKPILSFSPKESEVEELLNQTKSGINVEYNDIAGIENAILKYYNDWKDKKQFKMNEDEIKKYERRNLTKKLAKVFESILEE